VTAVSSRQAELAAARLLLERMGISVQDLASAAEPDRVIPTFAEYVPRVAATVTKGTQRAYGTYWKRLVEHWGDRRIDAPSATEIEQLRNQIRASVVVRRNGRGGRSAVENFVSAVRCLYRRAVADGLIREADNPAAKVAKPRRLAGTRRALNPARLAEINEAAATSGDDPVLDCLLLRLHTETACRRGGALGLRPRDLDAQLCLIYLREKGGTTRWQPVSPTLMRHLLAHTTERGGDPDTALLRYRNGTPLTYRRYDHLWVRIGQRVPWVRTQQISTHWLRHTTLTWVDRNFGAAVARAFAGHTDGENAGSTATYVKANLEEVAAAVAALTGEEHPLARTS
jgi:site-specific recombinase XerC